MASLQIILTTARVVLSLVFLLYASWSDYKTREVSNRVWMFFAPLALLLSVAEMLLFSQTKLFGFGLSFVVTTVIALLLFYAGAFGGADSKALICIALALPFFSRKLCLHLFYLEAFRPWLKTSIRSQFSVTLFLLRLQAQS
jgi:archaeal preflagellin peptidase FlaK